MNRESSVIHSIQASDPTRAHYLESLRIWQILLLEIAGFQPRSDCVCPAHLGRYCPESLPRCFSSSIRKVPKATPHISWLAHFIVAHESFITTDPGQLSRPHTSDASQEAIVMSTEDHDDTDRIHFVPPNERTPLINRRHTLNTDAESLSAWTKESHTLASTTLGERLPYANYTTIDWMHDLVRSSPHFASP